MRKVLFIVLLFFSLFSSAQNINIHIYDAYKVDTFYLKVHEGKYDVIAGNELLLSLHDGEYARFTIRKGKTKISTKSVTYTTEKAVIVRGTRNACYFTVYHPRKKFPERSFDNDVIISVDKNTFKLINDVNFDKYIAGVVEAEGGSKAEIEYYKAQAILCRTYAAKHYTKHLESDGYNLCDGVHCQAFKGRCTYNLDILDASLQTAGLVIVDSSRNPISALFYANSGGQTSNSEDVWTNALPYLRSVEDTFSLGMRAEKWEKKIPLQKWNFYLEKKGYSFEQYEEYKPFRIDTLLEREFVIDTMRIEKKEIVDSIFQEQTKVDSVFQNDSIIVDSILINVFEKIDVSIQIDTIWGVSDTVWYDSIVYDTIPIIKSQKHYPIDYCFAQPERKKYYSFRGCDTILKLTQIRTDWKLRSTFFDVYVDNNNIVLHGRGYGHGVGLSQEGAMKMALKGYTYDEIIKFYFTGVQIMSVRALKFFQELDE